MIHVIMGLKGSGKTKKLIDSVKDAVASARGDVVCIEYDKKLTYDLPHKVRLVDSKEYGISNSDMLKGLLSGLHAGNYDITCRKNIEFSACVVFVKYILCYVYIRKETLI